jgi:hypothetical protein
METLYYDDLIHLTWEETKNKYLKMVGRWEHLANTTVVAKIQQYKNDKSLKNNDFKLYYFVDIWTKMV